MDSGWTLRRLALTGMLVSGIITGIRAQDLPDESPKEREWRLLRRLERVEGLLQAVRETLRREDLVSDNRIEEIRRLLDGSPAKSVPAGSPTAGLKFQVRHLGPHEREPAACEPGQDRCRIMGHWQVEIPDRSFPLTRYGLVELQREIGRAALMAREPGVAATAPSGIRFTMACPPETPYAVLHEVMVSGSCSGFREILVTAPSTDGTAASTAAVILLPPSDGPCHQLEPHPDDPPPLHEVRMLVARDQDTGDLVRFIGSRSIPPGKIGDDILFGVLEQEVKAAAAAKLAPILIIDAAWKLVWSDLAGVFDIARRAGFPGAEFVFGSVIPR